MFSFIPVYCLFPPLNSKSFVSAPFIRALKTGNPPILYMGAVSDLLYVPILFQPPFHGFPLYCGYQPMYSFIHSWFYRSCNSKHPSYLLHISYMYLKNSLFLCCSKFRRQSRYNHRYKYPFNWSCIQCLHSLLGWPCFKRNNNTTSFSGLPTFWKKKNVSKMKNSSLWVLVLSNIEFWSYKL